jgi:hypothetical protein
MDYVLVVIINSCDMKKGGVTQFLDCHNTTKL